MAEKSMSDWAFDEGYISAAVSSNGKKPWISIDNFLVHLFKLTFELRKYKEARQIFDYLNSLNIDYFLSSDMRLVRRIILATCGVKLGIYNRDEICKEIEALNVDNPLVQLIKILALIYLQERYSEEIEGALYKVKEMLNAEREKLESVIKEDPEVIEHFFVDLDIDSMATPLLTPLYRFFIEKAEDIISKYNAAKKSLERLKERQNEMLEEYKLSKGKIKIMIKKIIEVAAFLGLALSLILILSQISNFMIAIAGSSLVTVVISILKRKLERVMSSYIEFKSEKIAEKTAQWFCAHFYPKCKKLLIRLKECEENIKQIEEEIRKIVI